MGDTQKSKTIRYDTIWTNTVCIDLISIRYYILHALHHIYMYTCLIKSQKYTSQCNILYIACELEMCIQKKGTY